MRDFNFKVTSIGRDENNNDVAKVTIEFDNHVEALTILEALYDEIIEDMRL